MENPEEQKSVSTVDAIPNGNSHPAKKRKKRKKPASKGGAASVANQVLQPGAVNGVKQSDESSDLKSKIIESSGGENVVTPTKKKKRNRRKRKKVGNPGKEEGDNEKEDASESQVKRMKTDNSAAPAEPNAVENGTPKATKKRKKRNRNKKKANGVEESKEEGNEEPKVKRLKVDNESKELASPSSGESKPVAVPVENPTTVGKKKKKKARRRKKKAGNSAVKETAAGLPESADKKGPEATNNLQNNADGAKVEESKRGAKKKRRRQKKAKDKTMDGRVQLLNKVEEKKAEALKNVSPSNPSQGKKRTFDGDIVKETTLNIVKPVTEEIKNKDKLNKNPKSPIASNPGKTAVNVTPAKLNDAYSEQSRKEEITKCWTEGSPLQRDNGFELLSEPFKCSYMTNFLKDSSVLQKVKEELSAMKFNVKNNDLYKFSQSVDLKNVSSPYIASLRKFLYGDFRQWLSDVTGIKLDNKVDMGSSKYVKTDGLLCHDDELEGRRVAYILYLTPPWYDKDGGMLDLFDVDDNGEPKDVAQSLLPKWNTFAFFEVSPVSYHQVREILSKDKVRLSINGWFHGPSVERPPKLVGIPRALLSPVEFDEEEFYSWINPSYLDAKTQKEIRKKFQSDSEIELESFLCSEKYEEVSKALLSGNLKWLNTGPANKQSCKVLKDGNIPDIITACSKFLKSEALFLILSQITGLKLHSLAPPDSDPDSDEDEEVKKDSSPGMTLDIRQWSPGCYTLLRDSDQGERTRGLDCSLFVNVADKWALEYGGYTSYIAKDEDEELLTVEPRSNCFALVFRDAETLKFTKYINGSAKDLGKENCVFFDFNCTYKE